MENTSSERPHGSNGSNISYGKSWAEDVQNYKAKKSVLPWLPEEQEPVKYVTRYKKAREEREYDIVRGRFRDDEKELSYQQQQSTQLSCALAKSRAEQLRTIQPFDVINNTSKFSGAKEPTDKQPVVHPNRKKNAVGYNILSNIPDNGSCDLTLPRNGSTSRKPHREFNVVTNRYHDRHEARVKEEAELTKRIAAQKYFKTRAFDPVRITYVDVDHENHFLSRRDKEQQVHGKNRVLSLPPSEQLSEGRLYNILNQRVIDSKNLSIANEKTQRALNKIKKTAFETEMRKVGDNQQARENDRSLNRFTHECQSETHSFTWLSNQSDAGQEANIKCSNANKRGHT